MTPLGGPFTGVADVGIIRTDNNKLCLLAER